MGAATHILTVDVGNTTTRLGVYTLPADREDAAAPELIGACDLTTPDRATADELRIQLAQAQGILPMAELAGSILSCVVPTLTETWRHALASVAQTRPLVVGPGLKSGIRMRYDDPSEVGADRIAGIVAARAAYELPAVVVDLGTTTNFDVIDATGAFAGGIIAPRHRARRAVPRSRRGAPPHHRARRAQVPHWNEHALCHAIRRGLWRGRTHRRSYRGHRGRTRRGAHGHPYRW